MTSPIITNGGLALLFGVVVFGVGAWQALEPMDFLQPREAAAMGRSGTLLVDDTLPETLTPRDNRSLQGSSIFFIGVSMSGNNKVLMTGLTVAETFNLGKPTVLIMVNAPKDGWYIVNCVTTGAGEQATLTKSAPTPVTVASWDYRNRPPGTHLFPALVELKKGVHYFYWRLEAGSVEFLETHILKAKIEG